MQSVAPGSEDPTPPTSQPDQQQIKGVLRWKGNPSGNGLYVGGKLTPQSVNPASFGTVAHYKVDGVIQAQPLYVSNLEMGALGTHNVVIIATEHDDIQAFDADGKSASALWSRSYLGPGVTTGSGIFGGRTGLGPEVGITGTPVIDPATGAMYFVTLISKNGTIEQWLRSVDIRSGKDFGAGSVKIQATVKGDGPGSVNGEIAFDAAIHNQRPGLALVNGQVVIAWGSYSDQGTYRGWLMAYDAGTLQQTAAYSPATQYQAQDAANGPADHGGGASIWSGGAAPSVDAEGNIYVVTADGSFNADSGGVNYGDSVLRLKLSGNTFAVQDYFTPSCKDCLDQADLDLGSGGLVLLPADAGGGGLAIVVSKEGRLYLLNPSNLGKFDATDSQIPQQFLVGDRTCQLGQDGGFAEGPDWQRLYGNPTYWNGSVYLAPANTNLMQFRFAGGKLSTTPASRSGTAFSFRGANVIVSANGNADGIVWAETKDGSANFGLHAYDATNVSRELWNNRMASSNAYPGVQFANPVVVDNKVIAAGSKDVFVFGLK